ncbi:MAG: MBL fold metallo-hydrolase [Clostridia bacterium]|jgi:ribonuclease BN (tRNA processing enzyme)|nr:MBL fold metallo-hydrolase [Clostridia bacterium]
MKLTCFGRYGPYPKGGSATSCYMISHDGKNVLIELGCGGLSKFLAQYTVADIDAIVLSHLHADHMGDMLTLRYALKVAQINGSITKGVPVYCPDKPKTEAGMLAADPLMDTVPLCDGYRCKIFNMDVSFAHMPHPYESFAMRFSADDKTFVYSGDVMDNDRLAVFAKDADLFLMEAALQQKDVHSKSAHLSAVRAGEIGMQANAKRMLITHLFPEYDERDVISEVRQHYKEARMIEENKTYEV